MGSLSVFRETSSTMDLLWTESGDVGDQQWRTAGMDVASGVDIKVNLLTLSTLSI